MITLLAAPLNGSVAAGATHYIKVKLQQVVRDNSWLLVTALLRLQSQPRPHTPHDFAVVGSLIPCSPDVRPWSHRVRVHNSDGWDRCE